MELYSHPNFVNCNKPAHPCVCSLNTSLLSAPLPNKPPNHLRAHSIIAAWEAELWDQMHVAFEERETIPRENVGQFRYYDLVLHRLGFALAELQAVLAIAIGRTHIPTA